MGAVAGVGIADIRKSTESGKSRRCLARCKKLA
jgi:hypothetical protein